MGSTEKGFHFLGINYSGTQPQDNITVTQANVSSANLCEYAHSLILVGRKTHSSKHCLRQIASFRIRKRCVKHASRSIKWSKMRSLLAASHDTCIVGARGGYVQQKTGDTRNYLFVFKRLLDAKPRIRICCRAASTCYDGSANE